MLQSKKNHKSKANIFYFREWDICPNLLLGFAAIIVSLGFLIGKANAKSININEKTIPAKMLRISLSLKSCILNLVYLHVSYKPKTLYVKDLYLKNKVAK